MHGRPGDRDFRVLLHEAKAREERKAGMLLVMGEATTCFSGAIHKQEEGEETAR